MKRHLSSFSWVWLASFSLVFLRILWINRHWSRSELRLSTLPGVVGGPFAGVAILHQTFPAGNVIEVNLKRQLSQTVRQHKSTTTKHVDMELDNPHQSSIVRRAAGHHRHCGRFCDSVDCLATRTGTSDAVGYSHCPKKTKLCGPPALKSPFLEPVTAAKITNRIRS